MCVTIRWLSVGIQNSYFRANLNNDYFKDRQDRYVSLSNTPLLADYFHGLIKCLSDLSFTVTSAPKLSLLPPPALLKGGKNERDKFRRECATSINMFATTWRDRTSSTKAKMLKASDFTVVAPALQMDCFNMRQEQTAMMKFFEIVNHHSYSVSIAAGYLNMPRLYETQLLKSKAILKLITSSPQVFRNLHRPTGSTDQKEFRGSYQTHTHIWNSSSYQKSKNQEQILNCKNIPAKSGHGMQKVSGRSLNSIHGIWRRWGHLISTYVLWTVILKHKCLL